MEKEWIEIFFDIWFFFLINVLLLFGVFIFFVWMVVLVVGFGVIVVFVVGFFFIVGVVWGWFIRKIDEEINNEYNKYLVII